MAEARVDRDTRLNIRVHQSVYDRMHALADTMGIAAATLGAVAISEYLARQELPQKQQEAIARSMTEVIGPTLTAMLEKLAEQEGATDEKASPAALPGARKRV